MKRPISRGGGRIKEVTAGSLTLPTHFEGLRIYAWSSSSKEAAANPPPPLFFSSFKEDLSIQRGSDSIPPPLRGGINSAPSGRRAPQGGPSSL